MSEAELHVLRARLDGGIRNKAARGELRRGLPVGLVWGEADGEILHAPRRGRHRRHRRDLRPVRRCGSVRGDWLWLRDQGLKWPLQPGAYVRGSRDHLGRADLPRGAHHADPPGLRRRVCLRPDPPGTATLGQDGTLRIRRRVLPQDQWEVLIPDHHQGFIDWDAYQANQARIGRTSARWPTSPAPARSAKAARCCRAWPPAGPAAASSPSTTTASTRPPPATTAPAPATSSTAAAPGTCGSAASPSTPRSPPRSWPRSSRPRCKPAWKPPGSSNTATTPP